MYSGVLRQLGQDEKAIAVKQFRFLRSADPKNRVDAAKDILVLQHLQKRLAGHPAGKHLVHLHGAIWWRSDHLEVVMEHAQLGDLWRFVLDHQDMTNLQRLDICNQILLLCETLAELCLVNRDYKPGNFLVFEPEGGETRERRALIKGCDCGTFAALQSISDIRQVLACARKGLLHHSQSCACISSAAAAALRVRMQIF